MTFKIFISYSQDDFLERGRIIHNYLSNMFPDDDVFIDQSKTKAKKWREENDKKLKASDLVILIITPAAIRSNEVAREVKISNELKKSVLPCKIQDLKLDWEKLPWNLGSLDGIPFKNDEDLKTSLYGTVTEIRNEYLNKVKNTSSVISDYISIITDKEKYSDGEEIKISGRVKELLSNVLVNLQVISPNRNLVTIQQIDVDSEKYFFSVLQTGGALWKNQGTYTIKVVYGSAIRSSETTFDFVGSSGISKSTTSENIVTVEGSSHSINYQIKGGDITSVVRDPGTSSLLIGLAGTENGQLTITIPRDLLDARIENKDHKFYVSIDGELVDFDEKSTISDRILTIEFSKGSEEIEIIGISEIHRKEIPLFQTLDKTEVSQYKVHTVSLSASVDRTVYPLDSIIYARANLNDIIMNEPIIFEIYNSKNKLLGTKKINPVKYSNSILKKSGIYETSFKMKGNDWKTNESYSLFAKHGDAESMDKFSIDKRMPIVQTDKSVYIRGSDMIVTVIDPDADKDSKKVEFVGNRKNSLLTISTSEGEIKKYKLRETGESTGIFQGVVGLIGVNDSGKIQGYSLGKKTIKKTQGKGIADGFIGVKRGGEILLTYDNGYGKAELVAFSSNFGVAVELDQKVYTWTDKVRITVVAPDFNTNSDKVESIGNGKQGSITIKTKLGKLENYELVETGTDTGIFVGEIQLTGFPYDKLDVNAFKKLGKTSGNGPNKGMIVADSKDGLVVEFQTQGETYTASAIIRWNIGEVQWQKSKYHVGDTGSFVIIDPDANLNPNLIDIFKVRVWSDTDPVGTEIMVIETGQETGIFFGDIQFGNKTKPGASIKVSLGDTVVVEYEDHTLPEPYKKGDSLVIEAHTTITEN